MIRFFQQLYISNRFYALLGAIIISFVISFFIPPLFYITQIILAVSIAFLLVDIFVLFNKKNPFIANRKISAQISVGDNNKVSLRIRNNSPVNLHIEVIDETPYQLQLRDLKFNAFIQSGKTTLIEYTILPTERGIYEYNNLVIYSTSIIGLAKRKYEIDLAQTIKAYPSIIQMKKHELNVFSKTAIASGVKKIRKIGNTNEFEQIKDYIQGDNIRHINWRATSRKSALMVNQYEDEKSQQVYCIVDKSRSMKMPFNGLTLLDHAINSSLVISNISIKKGDRAGLITFSDKIGDQLPSSRKSTQLKKILDILYRQKTEFLEPNYNLLYHSVKNTIKGRSLVFLYTNFETIFALKRALPILRRLNKSYLLIVVFFENSEIAQMENMEVKTIKDMYLKTFAGNLSHEKHLYVEELKKYGIQSILSKPESLTINSINKYLELKAKRMI